MSLDRNDLLCLQNSIANGALGALGQTDGSAGSFNCGNSNGSVLQRSDVISSSDDLATNGANTAGSEAGLGASGLLSLCLFNLVSDLIGNYSLAAELFFANGAVYDIVVRAGSGASSFNLVFYNDFASLVTQSGISNDALVGNVATIALSGLGAICSASSILVCNVLSEGVTESRNFLLLNGELFADGALHTSSQTCLIAGGSGFSNKFCGVAGCFDNQILFTFDLCITNGAVDNGVIGTSLFALRSYYVLLNSLSGGMLELLGGLSLARNLFIANGAVNYGIVGAFLCASSSNFVFNYSLCGGVTLGAGSSGLNIGDLVTCGSEYFETLGIDHHRSLFTLEILSNGEVQSNDNVCILIFLCIGVGKYEYGSKAIVILVSNRNNCAKLTKGVSLVVKGVTLQSQSGCIINNLKVDRAYTGVVCNFDVNINITGGNFDVAFGIGGVNRNAEGGSIVSCRNSNDSQRDHHYSNQKRY